MKLKPFFPVNLGKKKKLRTQLNAVLTGIRKRNGRGKRQNRGVAVSYTNPVPYKPLNLRSVNRDDAIISGSDWAQAVHVREANDKPGAVITDININPFTMTTTRLSKLAALYEFWEVIDLSVTFQGAQATDQPGLFTGFFDYDVTDDLTATSISTRNLEIAAAHSDSVKSTRLWETQTWHWSDKSNIRLKKLFCNPTTDPTTSSAGRFYLLCANKTGTVGDNPVGTLSVQYRIRFHKPQLDDTLYGYGSEWDSDGKVTPAEPFGAAEIMLLRWGNLPLARDPEEKYITLYPGNYSVNVQLTGTGLTNSLWAVEGETQIITNTNIPNAAATSLLHFGQLRVQTATKLELTVTGTTLTWTGMIITSLPVDAIDLQPEINDAKSTLFKLTKAINRASYVNQKTNLSSYIDESPFIVEHKEPLLAKGIPLERPSLMSSHKPK